MGNVWLVVANHHYARIFTGAGGLHEIETLSCPEAVQFNQDLVSDAPGRTFDSHGQGRHAMEPRTTPKEHLEHQFARQIAARLERGRTDGACAMLALIAPPDFLGALRAALSPQCHKLIVEECPKNIVREDIPAIVSLLPFRIKGLLKLNGSRPAAS